MVKNALDVVLGGMLNLTKEELIEFQGRVIKKRDFLRALARCNDALKVVPLWKRIGKESAEKALEVVLGRKAKK